MNNRNLITGLLAFVLIAISSTFIVDEREVVIKFRLVKLYQHMTSQVYIS